MSGEVAAVDVSELATLCAVDGILFEKTFFAKTSRMEGAVFHPAMWDLLISEDRFVNFQVFRGGAKTTKLRLFTAHRVAYGFSRTIVYVGKSQDHAKRSVRWLRLQIERNKGFTDFYGLEPGGKWTDEELQIRHKVLGIDIWVVAFGVTGSVRGTNFDDYRPDLIVVDDVVDEENSATKEGREKIYQLVHGALRNSLAPRSEAPMAKMVIAQTPQDFEDISQLALKDPQFVSVKYGCWTEKTAGLPLEQRESSWPARWTSEELRQDKLAHLAKNKLSVFAREWECELVTSENSSFRLEWLQYFGDDGDHPEPELSQTWTVLVIDPVPPPSQNEVSKGLPKGDYEAFAVVGRYKGGLYLLETSAKRGHEPNWTVAEFFRLANKWRPRKVIVESVAYQRTLAWLLRQAMQRTGRYWPIEEFKDKRSKFDRILDGIAGVASNRQLYVRRSQHETITQYCHFGPGNKLKYDDELEVLAIGCAALTHGLTADEEQAGGIDDEADIEALPDYRGAP